MNRRSLLLGLGAAIAAPAVVRASSLMRIAVLRETMSVKHVKAIADIMKQRNGNVHLTEVIFDGKSWVFTQSYDLLAVHKAPFVLRLPEKAPVGTTVRWRVA